MFDDERTRDWAGGGGWNDDPPPPSDPPKPPPPPAPPAKPKPKRTMPPYRPKVARGLVAGRFLPLHLGHEHLIEVATRSSEKLDIVVFVTKDDPLPAALRVKWLRETYPSASVYETVATDDFAACIEKATGSRKYDAFYGGEIAVGIPAAKSIGATFVPVDPEREAFPISGTQIRENVMLHFGEISSVARPWFVRRVAVIGPESTGKTELCKRLAQIYSTRFVPEPARALAAARGGEIDPEAVEVWIRTQLASEEAVARRANRLLFADTHARTALVWSQRLFDEVPADLKRHLNVDFDYDLVLFCMDDVPFVGRPERDQPDARRAMCRALSVAENQSRLLVEGTSWESRLLTARKAVDQLLARKGFLSKRGEQLVASGAG